MVWCQTLGNSLIIIEGRVVTVQEREKITNDK